MDRFFGDSERMASTTILQQDSPKFILQLKSAPLHYHWDVRAELNKQLPKRWIRRTDPNNNFLYKMNKTRFVQGVPKNLACLTWL